MSGRLVEARGVAVLVVALGRIRAAGADNSMVLNVMQLLATASAESCQPVGRSKPVEPAIGGAVCGELPIGGHVIRGL